MFHVFNISNYIPNYLNVFPRIDTLNMGRVLCLVIMVESSGEYRTGSVKWTFVTDDLTENYDI